LLNFKITLKAFSFKLNSSNKSCRAKLLEYNKTCLTIFGFFYKFLVIFKVDSFELRRVLISYRKDPRKIKKLAIGSLAGFYRKTDQRRSNSGEGAHRQQGKSGGKGSGAYGDHGGGWNRGRKGLRRRVNGEPSRCGEAPRVVPENDGEVARKLL
jgi:hypothetical protein